MIVKSVLGRRLAATYHQADNTIIQRCKASTASPQVATKNSKFQNSDHSATDNVEWKDAKPFDDVPGFRVLPVLGTMWGIIGKLSAC